MKGGEPEISQKKAAEPKKGTKESYQNYYKNLQKKKIDPMEQLMKFYDKLDVRRLKINDIEGHIIDLFAVMFASHDRGTSQMSNLRIGRISKPN